MLALSPFLLLAPIILAPLPPPPRLFVRWHSSKPNPDCRQQEECRALANYQVHHLGV